MRSTLMVDEKLLDEISKEIESAREKYGKIANMHEAYSIILEELDEFWDSIKGKEDMQKTRKELIQVVSACFMALEDVFR